MRTKITSRQHVSVKNTGAASGSFDVGFLRSLTAKVVIFLEACKTYLCSPRGMQLGGVRALFESPRQQKTCYCRQILTKYVDQNQF